MASKKITVIGSSNTDMVLKSSHLPAPGETVLGGNFAMKAGGKGANQAVAAAKLRGDVTFIAKVGNDIFGEQAIANFKDQGIDTRFITKDETVASGVALIMVDAQGENSISVALGANDRLSKDDLNPAIELLKESSYVLMQLESPMALVEHVAMLSQELGFRLVLNPAPAQQLSNNVLQSLYMLTPNSVEAELLSGIKVIDEATARKAATKLRETGVEIVIITMGSKGAYVLSVALDELIPCPKVQAVDTTAAGDTFNGSLLVALSEGQHLREAIVFANRAAAYSVGILGAQNSAPSREDLETII
ncbi:ribokinase [Fulvivirgaceae bacterium BMA12]|uniref:Ribokinase n=1 Tax=Agaribacillus aureus TaxID=3051825 RepID=A0ABT8L8U9_9BACT|nr:ribokinase [Fulvivirgaceae bacterium BMA12]